MHKDAPATVYVPAGQITQAVEPVTGAYIPNEQLVHAVTPAGEYVLTEQLGHAAAPVFG